MYTKKEIEKAFLLWYSKTGLETSRPLDFQTMSASEIFEEAIEAAGYITHLIDHDKIGENVEIRKEFTDKIEKENQLKQQ